MNDTLLNRGQEVLASQPFSKLLDVQMVAFEAGRVELSLPISDSLRQQHGFVHGGVLSYLADNSLTFAAGSVLGDSVTVEHKVNYLRPARGDGQLVAVGSVVGSGKTQAVCRCEIYIDDGQQRVLCAAGQGTVRKV